MIRLPHPAELPSRGRFQLLHGRGRFRPPVAKIGLNLPAEAADDAPDWAKFPTYAAFQSKSMSCSHPWRRFQLGMLRDATDVASTIPASRRSSRPLAVNSQARGSSCSGVKIIGPSSSVRSNRRACGVCRVRSPRQSWTRARMSASSRRGSDVRGSVQRGQVVLFCSQGGAARLAILQGCQQTRQFAPASDRRGQPLDFRTQLAQRRVQPLSAARRIVTQWLQPFQRLDDDRFHERRIEHVFKDRRQDHAIRVAHRQFLAVRANARPALVV